VFYKREQLMGIVRDMCLTEMDRIARKIAAERKEYANMM